MKTYSEALNYLNSFLNYEQFTAYRYPQAFSLDRMRRFLKRLGDPHRSFESLHVAGTKGKGSTCAFAASLLKALGKRVGLYTSPHLVSFRERIQVAGESILEEELAGLVAEIRPCVREDLTYFEVTTGCAFLYFARKKVEVAVVEVGLGGRLDATNLLAPAVCGITPISFDHMDKLGCTLGAIAREKAGIIKRGIPVATALQAPEAFQAIEEAAKANGAPLHAVAKEVSIQETEVSAGGSRINIKTPLGDYPDLSIPLMGRHQWMNAALALRMVELGWGPAKEFSPEAAREGFRKTQWPGRCQLIEGDPPVLLDGAQNAASSQALVAAVKELFPQRKIILILGASTEKDLSGMAQVFGPWAQSLVFTRAQVPRAESQERLAGAFRRWHPNPRVTPSVEEALEEAKALAGPGDLIVVAGSLFVAGEALGLLKQGACSAAVG